ncbi:hypothetical protein BDV37DRAFT_266742 [Aspergillus pseudonomiae]|uniref:Uncharacterized protein n=1 Tax=Aspergillus pseudonomiae TaxID=1506151 RepID=A0A5N7CTT1_9EURO|nr:uncharacterized protein BDV37DRAFT_266742 [Aspergillus pseudonomiae]KAE8397058.1 hypothetical protein BDV37DRAFT_266742 [Aspergillus pseudonomiae]
MKPFVSLTYTDSGSVSIYAGLISAVLLHFLAFKSMQVAHLCSRLLARHEEVFNQFFVVFFR